MQRVKIGIAVVNPVDAANLLLANPKLQNMLLEMPVADTQHAAAGGSAVNGNPHTCDVNTVDTACVVKVSPLAVAAGAIPLAVAAPLQGPFGGASPSALDGGQRFVKVLASLLKTLLGLEGLDDHVLAGKTLRQLAQGQFDRDGKDISGYFVVSDVAASLIFHNQAAA